MVDFNEKPVYGVHAQIIKLYEMEKLNKDLLRLQTLDDSLSRQFDEHSQIGEKDWRNLLHKAAEIVELKTSIRTEFAKSSTFVFKEDNSESKIILEKIRDESPFFADLVIRTFEETTGHSLDLEDLDLGELDQLASDELYSWFGPTEYIERLIEIGALILDIHIPPKLEFIVEETRRCYAFEQHIAVYSLCRTLLESAMRDICLRTGEIHKIENPKEFYDKYPPGNLIQRLSKHDPDFNQKIRDLYYGRLSPIIHGLLTNDSNGVLASFRETALMVQELYERNRGRISSLEGGSSNF